MQRGFNSDASPVYNTTPQCADLTSCLIFSAQSWEVVSTPEREETQRVFIRALNRAQAGARACAEPQLQWYYTAFMLWAVSWTAESWLTLAFNSRLFSLKNHRRFTDISTVSTRPPLAVHRHCRHGKQCRTEGQDTTPVSASHQQWDYVHTKSREFDVDQRQESAQTSGEEGETDT